MKKNKILLFIDWFVPAYKAGGPIRSVYNLVQTFKNDAEWFVVTSTKDLGETEELEGIIKNKWTLQDEVNVIYLDESHQTVDTYKKIIQEIRPNKFYLNSLFSKNFTLLPIQAYKQKGCKEKLIIAPRGMFSKGALAIKPLKKKLFFVYAKLMGMFKGVIWHASSEIEKNEIHLILGRKVTVYIAPNVSILPENSSAKNKSQNNLNILMVSRISPIKNIHILLEAVGRSLNKPHMLITIIGNVEDENYKNSCLKIVDEFQLKVNFVGAVPNPEIKPYYDSNELFCSPTDNENYGHAIVEALSFGLPLLISQNTPWRQLQEKGVGFDLPLEVKDFTAALDTFVEMTPEEYSNYSANALEYAKSILLNPEVIASNKKLFLD